MSSFAVTTTRSSNSRRAETLCASPWNHLVCYRNHRFLFTRRDSPARTDCRQRGRIRSLSCRHWSAQQTPRGEIFYPPENSFEMKTGSVARDLPVTHANITNRNMTPKQVTTAMSNLVNGSQPIDMVTVHQCMVHLADPRRQTARRLRLMRKMTAKSYD